MNNRIIVTGGAGFIGSAIIKKLNERGYHDIIVVDNLSNADKHRNLNNRVFTDFIHKSRFLDQLEQLGKIEYIFHEGACSDTTNSDGNYMMANNYAYTKAIVDFCVQNQVDLSYASSASIYGDGSLGFDDSHSNYFPLNIYAFSKLMVDRYVEKLLFHGEINSQIVGLRYFNVFGYNENHKGKMKSVIAKFYEDHIANRTSSLFEGSDKILRDFIYINDLLKLVFYLFDNRQNNGIFNCGTGKTTSFEDLAKYTQLNLENFEYKYVEFPNELRNKYQFYTKANTEKFAKIGFDMNQLSTKNGVDDYCSILKKSGGIV